MRNHSCESYRCCSLTQKIYQNHLFYLSIDQFLRSNIIHGALYLQGGLSQGLIHLEVIDHLTQNREDYL